jgi:hypothetical protein
MNICLVEKGELFWLFRVEDAVITVEVKPITSVPTVTSGQGIGKVMLRRLMSAEQVIERLGTASARCHLQNIELIVQ